MKVGPKELAAAALPDKLRKRERAGMAAAFAMAFSYDAFSIAFDIKPKAVRTIIYLKRPMRAEQRVDLEPEEDDGEHDGGVDDELAPAPASAGAVYRQLPTKSSAPSSKPSTQAKDNTSTPSAGKPKLTHAKGTPKAKQVDRNALSARGSPTGEQSSHDSPMHDDQVGERDDSTDSNETLAPKKARRAFKAWQTPMFRAAPGPPPPAQLRAKGKWCTAFEAYLQYGDPSRQVWIRKSDGKIWEADGDDHLAGYRREDG